MANDMNSLNFSEEFLKPEVYVISAASFIENDFIEKVAMLKRKTLFRIGGAYLGEIEDAVNIFKNKGNNDIVLLHGFQNYPTKLEETNLSFLKSLKDIFDLDELADHIDGAMN